MSNLTKKTIWFLTLCLIGFAIYLPGIDIPYYSDDFGFIVDSHLSSILSYFYNKSAHNWYRLIEAVFLAFIQNHFQMNTIPIHISIIFTHIILSYFIFIFLLKFNFLYSQAILGSLFMLLSQTNVLAVLGNDTVSQVNGTLFGVLVFGFYIVFSY